MFIDCFNNNGSKYLRLAKSVRTQKTDGRKTIKKVPVLNLGPLSRFDDGEPNYLERLRQSFREGKPLIPALLPYVGPVGSKKYKIEFEVGSKYCAASPKRFAPCLLDPVFSAIGLDQLFASIKHNSKIEYDLQGIVRLLTYSRILEPASKMATMRQKDKYYRPLVKSTNDDNVYDVLDIIYENRAQITQRINTCITRGIGRSTNVVYYDVTNFFFEIDNPDEDKLDDNGSIIEKGLRKLGVSKEERNQPIVQVGLFLDDNGIPISIEIFPGNTLDHQTLRPAMKNTVDPLNMQRFIMISDRGIYNGTNMCHILDKGHGYIVSKSLKKSKKTEREWTQEQNGYTIVSPNFKYKSRIVTRNVKDENGKNREIKQKVVVYWSRSFYEREKLKNQSFLDFIEKLKSNPSGFRISNSQSKKMKKFLKKEFLNKETGEIVDSYKLLPIIDEDKLTEFNELMGYYQIVTSELDMDDLEIIEKYHGLTQIEDQFHEMKETLETRPVYVSTPQHIYAHLMICFMALTMMRVMQHKIKKSLPEDRSKDFSWSYGLPGYRFSNALLDWQVEQLSEEYYRMVNTDSDDLKMILNAFDISIPLDLFTRGQLRSFSSFIEVF